MVVDAQGNEVGKLFVGGLHQSTTNDSLKAYFSKFGDIEESIVMMDNRTGRSRGFGYIKFKENSSVDSVLAQKPHSIDHKEVDPKRCNVNMKGKNRRSLKVFVGGISLDQDENTIRNFFSKYGRVTEVNLLVTPNKQRHRGFAFVGFDDEEVVKVLIRMHFLNMDGKKVEIKAMEPPLGQRVGYSTPSGYTMHHPSQLNGRAVRGGRGNQFNSLPSNEYVAWNQWNPMGATGWTSFIDNSQSWTPNPVGWLNRTNGTVPCSDMVRQNQIASNRFMELNHQNSSVGWTDSSTGSTNGWIPPGWNHQNIASSSTSSQVPVLREDLSLYNNPTQPQPPKPPTHWDSFCYTHPSVMHQGNYFSPMESWATQTNNSNNTNNTNNNAIYHPVTTQTDWNRPLHPDSLQPTSQHWTDTNSNGTNTFRTTGYLPDSVGGSHSNQGPIATMFATGAANGANAFGINTANAVASWASAATAVASDLGNLKLDDSTYRSHAAYLYPRHNALPLTSDPHTPGPQAFSGPSPNEWPSGPATNSPGPQSIPPKR